MLARVTGSVIDVSQKRGSKNGREWALNIATVLVAKRGVAEVSEFPPSDGSPSLLVVGEDVDLLVEVSSRGGFVQASVRGEFPHDAALLHAVS